ncbi:acyl-CoA dehydrogenase [Roseomonas sp. NAR14]|uniref:Acyl-CoA dehydrogenase n=1 Tax=Roseomonas acroporae TaxID=2937791 RepID=A0A9X1Y9Z2_9PROT|nr:acyl-CoA dehydrogenase family protein [Roseomonas acroporae]MCK8785872.1 acyl-CoA dehydrogenase [Roseomonas acroporae]
MTTPHLTTPAEDLGFALARVVDLPGLAATAGAPLGPDEIAAVLEEADRLARERIAPGRQEADRHGAVLEQAPPEDRGDGGNWPAVRTPPHYRDLYRAWIEGGWQGLTAEPGHGGQGLPQTLWSAVMELVSSADMAFGLCPLLSMGAIEALQHAATPAQRERWLPHLVSGEWTGTMCLTEPQAGSDLGALRTRAVPDGRGGYALHGQKIFITWGEHDLAANTLHLVLARLPDAPPGSRGISLFVAPKVLPDGRRNALGCGGLERKMGIHASPTCVMLFEGAEAELVGEPNRGLAAMFVMMNAARLGVGVEGVGQGARAVALAEAYAAGREQGGRPIAEYPDVARMLREMRSVTLAARLLALEASVALDRARLLGDAAAAARIALLTPIVKAWCTDRGIDVASLGVQVHGGAGFTEDAGAAQVLRDARIAPIYEGTNGIQAIDLVVRKVARDSGAAMRALLAEARGVEPRVDAALAALERATALVLAAQARDPAAAEGVAAAYLDACGWVLGGWMLARAAAAEGGAERYGALAEFYLGRLLPRAAARIAEVEVAG